MDKTLDFQDLFEGFQSTPYLWKGSTVYHLKQYSPEPTLNQFPIENESKKLRLGKWVENFVAYQLKHQNGIKLLEENLQIKDNKITIGELDLLFLQNEKPIHLEIVYKFYLYDSKQNDVNSLNNWVGPNRSDALVYKLKKLKEKQLPLLYHPKTKDVLEHYPFHINAIIQNVCFKAQLFLPYKNQNINVAPLNSDCVVGWYLNAKNIDELKDFQFYIPKKLEWLSLPKTSVNWLEFEDAKSDIETYIKDQRSPLCWIKRNNELQKCFITWW
ncbi:hypothetical protein DFQ10_10223 [Winogradskyella eximia]|uniref:DUF1853 family protein n=1 Tax=Winogradskyella eximia TaxID=262006 RepID=A0A3D9H864_9FLAO|nr:DUF1853 family protein [Winogradskyella eximia]RED45156.1 hypothetical protein DFQ10_10223 [Winogradskyella eximia]